MDYIEMLRGLIAIDTTVPPGRNYEQAVSYLEPFFREAGLDTEKVPIPPEHAGGREGRVALIAHHRRPGKPRLVFYSHVDVVPAEGWDAFTPKIREGKIYGRGAADMKGAIAGLLLGLAGDGPSTAGYDLSVAVTTDEEYSQAGQLRYLKSFLEPLERAALFSLDSSFGAVSIAALGALHIDILVKGKSVHSAMSHRGENAVEKASLLVEALLELKKSVTARRSAVETDPATGLVRMESRLNVNMIQGGLKINIVPDRCLIAIDRRLIPEESIGSARQELLDCLASVPGVRWEIDREYSIPTVPPTQDPLVDRLADIIQDVTGSTGRYGEMGSGDLSNIVVNEWGGIPFGLGVIRPECNIHGQDEFAYLKDIEALGEIISRFLRA